MMGKIPMETERGKKKLEEVKGQRKHECANCRNQTFLLIPCSDFPFFYSLCSKCGSGFVR